MKFIDTNVLIYLVDRHDEEKREIAKKLVADALRNVGNYMISSQTLAEFTNVCLRKFKMEPVTIRGYLCFFKGLRKLRFGSIFHFDY